MKRLILLLFVVACQRSSIAPVNYPTNYTGPVVKNDWMVSWLQANPETLNPVTGTDAYGTSVSNLIFDTLIAYNVMTGEPLPRLATSWTVSPDGLTYDFEIRSDAKFHDGKPLTAEDVKFSFDIIKDPKVDAAHLQNYFKNFKSCEILSPTKVRFHLTEVYFRNLIMLGLNQILPKHIYGVGDFNSLPANRAPIGSGPYKFVKWDTGRLIELERNKDYWGNNDTYWKDRYNFNKILFRVITEENVAAMALKKGEIDAIDPQPEQYVREFVGEEFEKNFYRIKYTTEDGNGFRFIGWNLRRPLFQSKKVRQAMAHAIARELMNEKVFQNLMTLSVGTFPQGSEKLSPNVKPIPYDMDKARALLKEEGWVDTNGDGILDKDGKQFSFELLFTAKNPEVEKIALIFQRSLQELGIRVNIKTLEWTVYLKNLMDDRYDAFMMAWGSSLDSDPYQIWHSSQIVNHGSNRVGFKNKRVDEILEEARRTLDRPKRNKLYQEFSEIIADEQPYLFLFERPALSIITKRFQGVLPLGKLGIDGDHMFTPMGYEKYKSDQKLAN